MRLYETIDQDYKIALKGKDALKVSVLRMVISAVKMLEIDKKGFDKMDRQILSAIIDKFGGGPVGIESLAASLHEEKDALEDVYEPYLMQEGFIQRTPRGRVATQSAYEHMGKIYKGNQNSVQEKLF